MGAKTTSGKTAEEILSSYPVGIEDIKKAWSSVYSIPSQIQSHLEAEIKYKVYLERHDKVK